jgi:hypothetical protein
MAENLKDFAFCSNSGILFVQYIHNSSQFQWPCGLRRMSTPDRLLELRVRIPPEAWMSASFKCLCCPVEVSATGRSLVQRSPTECGPRWAIVPENKKKICIIEGSLCLCVMSLSLRFNATSSSGRIYTGGSSIFKREPPESLRCNSIHCFKVT